MRHYTRLQYCALTLAFFLIATFSVSALAQRHPAAAPKTQSKSSPAPAQPHPSLSYASYLLNPGDRINALAKGVDGSVYAAGVTVPATVAADVTQPSAGAGNAFVAHFSADGKKLLYFSYLDNSGLDEARAIAVDANGYAYVTGETKSPAFPVVSAFQASCKTGASGACAGNAFVAKLDPSGKVVLASYLGGSCEDCGNAIAVDSKGNIYVAGSASSLDFPVTSALQSSAAGKDDAFVAAIASDGSHVLYATYLGGSDADEARGVAVDAQGNAYVTGVTLSLDFPTSGALQAKCAANTKGACAGTAFVSKLSADGSRLVYSTYLGGSGGDAGNAIAVDKKGNAYVAGLTNSSDFPVAKATQSALAGSSNAFVSKLSADGSALAFSTYLGGKVSDQANAIAVDDNGNVFVAGWTHSPDFPVKNPVQASCRVDGKHACTVDAFAAQLSASGAKLQFSTFLGGSGMDSSRGLAVDTQGSAYLGGWTTSRDFPQAQTVLAPGASSTNLKASSTKATTGSSSATSSTSSGSFVAKISGVTAPATTVTCGSGTKNWTGTAGDNLWTTANNWSNNAVPISTDNVCIDSTFSGTTITISGLSAANQTIASLNSGAPIVFQSGPLTITGTSSFYDLNITGDVLTLSGSSTMGTLEAGNGYLTGAGAITVSGLLTWSGGWMCTTYSTTGGCAAPTTQAVTNANGGISFTGYGYLDGRTLNTASGQTVSYVSGYAVYLYDNPIVNNVSGSTWDLGNDGSISGNSGVFNNAGTFTKSSGTGTSTVISSFNNTGTVNLTAATTDFQGGGDCGSACAGTWSVGTGATLQFDSGTFALSGGISGAGTVDFNGGTENLTGSYNITGATTVSGGTANFNGSVISVGPLTVNGGVANFTTSSVTTITTPTLTLGGGFLSGPDPITVSGLLTWGGGYMCTTYSTNTNNCSAPTTQAVTNANGGISFNGYGYLDGRTLNTATGKIVSYTSGYSLYLSDGAIVNNVSGSTWDLANDGSILSNSNEVFNNSGTFKKSSGTGTSSVSSIFNNTGTVTLTAATTDFSGSGDCGSTCAGTWSVATGATLQLSGTFALSGGISGAGTVNFPSGTTNLTGSYNITGATTVSGGTANFNGSVISVGPLTVNGGEANFTTSSVTTITTPTLTLGGGFLTGPDPITVSGLLTWGGGYMCTTYSTTTNNCSAPTTQAVTHANGGISFTGYGYLDGRTLYTASGKTVSYTSGYYLYLYDGAIVNNVSGSTWDLANDGSIQSTATEVFNNSGTFKKSSGAGTSSVSSIFNNTGTVSLTAATTDFSGGGNCGSTCAGTWSVGTGATLQFDSGTYALSGGISGAGTVNFSSGTETLSGAYTVTGPTSISAVVDFAQSSPVTMAGPLNLSSGYMYGPTTVSISGLLTWSGGYMCTTYASGTCTAPTTQAVTNADGGVSFTGYGYLDGRTLTTATGKIVSYIGTYSLYLYDGAVVNNVAGATWSLANDGSIQGGTTAVFNNAGTLIKSSTTTGTSNIYSQFNNTGSVQANAGVLDFAVFTQTAGSTSLGGGSITFDNPTTIQGGTFGGSGTVNGAALTNTGATLAPGTSTTAGSMSINGGYSQTSPGAMSIKIGGTSSSQFDHVAVSNPVTLGGPLSITLINGFTPTVGTGFTILTSTTSVSGTFSSVSSGWTVTYNPTSVVVTYQGGGNAPVVKLSATKLTFPTTVINTSSKPLTLKVTNTGTAALSISNIAISGTNATEYTYKTTTCTAVVNPGAYCTISVTFKPTDKGTRTATLTLTDNASPSTQSVPLTGVGTYVQVTPSPVAFPSQLLNTTSAPMTITVKNVSTVNTVTVTSITLAGTKAAEYTLSGSGSCTSILPGNTCTLTMTFTPNALGSQAVTLELFDDGGGSPQKVPVSGKGTYVTLSPSPLAFGSVTVGTSTSQTVTVTNTGPSTAITVKSVAFIGTNKADFKGALGSTCSSVAPNGGTCTITVTFKPAAKGARSATMNVTDTDLGSPQSDAVSGTGQ